MSAILLALDVTSALNTVRLLQLIEHLSGNGDHLMCAHKSRNDGQDL